jgi:hypothetical protein
VAAAPSTAILVIFSPVTAASSVVAIDASATAVAVAAAVAVDVVAAVAAAGPSSRPPVRVGSASGSESR